LPVFFLFLNLILCKNFFFYQIICTSRLIESDIEPDSISNLQKRAESSVEKPTKGPLRRVVQLSVVRAAEEPSFQFRPLFGSHYREEFRNGFPAGSRMHMVAGPAGDARNKLDGSAHGNSRNVGKSLQTLKERVARG
jgi:hypothetical protein